MQMEVKDGKAKGDFIRHRRCGQPRAGLSLNYVLKYVGDAVLSGLPMFSAASLVSTKLSML